jgi:hypothetical protein
LRIGRKAAVDHDIRSTLPLADGIGAVIGGLSIVLARDQTGGLGSCPLRFSSDAERKSRDGLYWREVIRRRVRRSEL